MLSAAITPSACSNSTSEFARYGLTVTPSLEAAS